MLTIFLSFSKIYIFPVQTKHILLQPCLATFFCKIQKMQTRASSFNLSSDGNSSILGFKTNFTNKSSSRTTYIMTVSRAIWPITMVAFRKLKPATWTQDTCTYSLFYFIIIDTSTAFFTPWNATNATPTIAQCLLLLLYLASLPWAIINIPYVIAFWADLYINHWLEFITQQLRPINVLMVEVVVLPLLLLRSVLEKVAFEDFKVLVLYVVNATNH